MLIASSVVLPALERDSTSQQDTLYAPLPFLGRLSALGIVQPYRSFSRADMLSVPYRTIEDVLEWRTPAYVLSTGGLGQWNVPLVLGERPRDQAVLYDGVSALSRTTGIVPLALVMPEFLEQFDVLTGSQAVVLAGSAGGAAYWVQQPWYNTRTPYTRVWYCQSAYDFIATDGILSQNIAPNLNTTAGFRRLVTSGRYTNEWLDAWNTRVLLRWNYSPTAAVSLVHRFTNWGVGTNGGVNTLLSDDPTNERTAVVMYSRLDQRLFRHELQLTGVAMLSPRSVLTASVAYRQEEWNEYRDSTLAVEDNSTHVRWTERAVSAIARLEEQLSDAAGFIAGIDASVESGTAADYVTALKGWQVTPHAYLTWQPRESVFSIRGGMRVVVRSGQLLVAGGAALSATIGALAATLDLSSAPRFPSRTEGEASPERVQQVIARVQWSSDSALALDAAVYVRQRLAALHAVPIQRGDTILAVRAESSTNALWERGAQCELHASVGEFRITPRLQLSFDGASRLPLLYASVSVQYQRRFGRNSIGGEFFLRARTAVRAERFIPQSWAYLPSAEVLPAAIDGGNVALVAQLGNATVKLAMGNILSSYYATLSTFPQFDRHITLSVAWSFFD